MISVIIPIFNAAPFLPTLFRQLCNQTFPDFEVILVNDGSTDCSGALCDAIAHNDPRFHSLHQENNGVSAARNHGIKAAQREYIAFLDADDEIPENYLGALLSAAEKTNSQMALCDVSIITDGVETNRFSCPDGILSQQEALSLLLSRQKINSGPYGKIFRRELLNDIVFPPLKAYEDILFVTNVICGCSQISATTQTEYRYVQNSTGAMHTFQKAPSPDIIAATDQLLAFLQARKDVSPLCFYVTVSHLMQYVRGIIDSKNIAARDFVSSAQNLYRKYLPGILSCSAFPWKEKVIFFLFVLGWDYHEKKLYRLR